jgi:hypothetical protein
MASQRDAENNRMSLNACVPLMAAVTYDSTSVTHYSSPGSSASQTARRGYVNPFFCVVILVDNHPGTVLESPNRTEDNPLDYPSSASKFESQVRS